MNNLKFLVLGAKGMAGHMIYTYLKEKLYYVDGVARRKEEGILDCDVTDFDKLDAIINNNNYDVVINCVGILNKAADEDKEVALMINSVLPHHLAKITKELKTRIFQISTDCVFSGATGRYTENSIPDGPTWYDKTKAMGELNNSKDLTFRMSIVGPDLSESGIGLFNWFMKQSGEINGYTNAMWTGITTLELAKVIELASQNPEVSGLFNCVNNEKISKFNLLKLFNKYMKKNLQIKPFDGVNLDKSLVRTNFDLNYKIPSYEQMVKEMSEWIYRHKDLYKHYSSIERTNECLKN